MEFYRLLIYILMPILIGCMSTEDVYRNNHVPKFYKGMLPNEVLALMAEIKGGSRKTCPPKFITDGQQVINKNSSASEMQDIECWYYEMGSNNALKVYGTGDADLLTSPYLFVCKFVKGKLESISLNRANAIEYLPLRENK
jgi:hypothetical protein